MEKLPSLFVPGFLLLFSNIWPYSGTRTVKKIETDIQPTFSKITVTVDDHNAGPEEYYVYKYNCPNGVLNCYLNNSENAKLVASIALTALSTGLSVRFDYDYTDPNTNSMFYFKKIEIMR